MESGRSVLEGSRNDAFVDRCCSWVRPGNQSGPRTIRADQPGREGGGLQSGHQEGVGRVTAEAGRLTEYSAQARADEAEQRGDYDSGPPRPVEEKTLGQTQWPQTTCSTSCRPNYSRATRT